MSLRNLLMIACLLLGTGKICQAQTLAYEPSLSNALVRAHAEGKFILGDFGRKDCVECVQTKAIWETPAVRGWLQSCAVLWASDVDLSEEWRSYATGLSSIALPLVTWIDPGKPGTRFHYRTGLVGPTQFTQHLTNQALKYLPIMVMNLPGSALTEASFTVQGVARTNALATGSITNVPISSVHWRLEKPTGGAVGEFQPVNMVTKGNDGSVSWSQQVSLRAGSNVFASFVRYADNRTSWTNRVPLIYDGPSLEPPEPAVIQLPEVAGGYFTFSIQAEPGRTVVVEESSTLDSWSPVFTNEVQNASVNVQLPLRSGSRYYRVNTVAQP